MYFMIYDISSVVSVTRPPPSSKLLETIPNVKPFRLYLT
jgi:hypothetical protein